MEEDNINNIPPTDDENPANLNNLFFQDNLGEKNQKSNFCSWDDTLPNKENPNNISNIPSRIISHCSYSDHSSDNSYKKNFNDFSDFSRIFLNSSKITEKNESFESNNINKENNEYSGIKTLSPPKKNIFEIKDRNENKKQAINKKRNKSKNNINNEINNIINEKENKKKNKGVDIENKIEGKNYTEERNKTIKIKTFFLKKYEEFLNKLLREKNLGQFKGLDPYYKKTINKDENLKLMNTTFKTIYEETRLNGKFKNKESKENRKIVNTIYKSKDKEIMSALNLRYKEAFKIFIRALYPINKKLKKKVSSSCPKILQYKYFPSWKTFLRKLKKDLKKAGKNKSFIKKYIYGKEGIKFICLKMKKLFKAKKGRVKKNNTMYVPNYLK